MSDTSTQHADTDSPRVLVVGLEDFSLRAGGLNRYAEDLVVALRDSGARAYLLVVGARSKLPSPDRLVVSATRILPLRLFRLWRAAQRVADDVDVVDVHFALHGLLLVHAGRLRRKPVVVHFHGPWAAESAAQGQNRFAVAAKRRVERNVYRKAAKIVVLSRAFKKLLVDEYGIPPWKIEVIPPGVDLERFSPGDRRNARCTLGLGDEHVVVTVRRLVPRMGHDVLLEAWSELVHRYEPGTMRLLVVGEGPLREELERKADRLGLGESVRFLGTVGPDRIDGVVPGGGPLGRSVARPGGIRAGGAGVAGRRYSRCRQSCRRAPRRPGGPRRRSSRHPRRSRGAGRGPRRASERLAPSRCRPHVESTPSASPGPRSLAATGACTARCSRLRHGGLFGSHTWTTRPNCRVGSSLCSTSSLRCSRVSRGM